MPTKNGTTSKRKVEKKVEGPRHMSADCTPAGVVRSVIESNRVTYGNPPDYAKYREHIEKLSADYEDIEYKSDSPVRPDEDFIKEMPDGAMFIDDHRLVFRDGTFAPDGLYNDDGIIKMNSANFERMFTRPCYALTAPDGSYLPRHMAQ